MGSYGPNPTFTGINPHKTSASPRRHMTPSMARLIRTAHGALASASASAPAASPCKLFFNGLRGRHHQPNAAVSSSAFSSQSRLYSTRKSLFESNILRILDNEIEYQSEYAPPHRQATKFNSFTVTDWPGEMWMTMTGSFGDSEDVKIEATMFDGYRTVEEPGNDDDEPEEDLQLHVSLLVDISKRDKPEEALEFVCSAWPRSLEIQKVYLLERDHNTLSAPFMGPDFRKLNGELRRGLREFLEARGVNDELAFFLHDFMVNKDRIELINWFGKVKSYVEN